MMPGMSGMPSGMQPPVSGASIPARPLFPSAAAAVSTVTASTAASVTGSAPLGTDFKPITSVASGGGSIGPVKPTFPAYSSAGESAGINATGNSLLGSSDQKVNLIATTGAASKIIHPPEDLSLVSFNFCSSQKFFKQMEVFSILKILNYQQQAMETVKVRYILNKKFIF